MSDNAFPTNNRGMNFLGVDVISFPLDPNLTDPGQVSDWTWLNKGSSTLTRFENNRTLSASIPTGGGLGTYRNRAITKPLTNPTAQWSFVSKHFDFLQYGQNGDFPNGFPRTTIGPCVVSSTDEILIFAQVAITSGFETDYAATVTSAPVRTVSSIWALSGTQFAGNVFQFYYTRISFDGVNLVHEISNDGNAWLRVNSIVSPLVSPINRYGFGWITGNNVAIPALTTIISASFNAG